MRKLAAGAVAAFVLLGVGIPAHAAPPTPQPAATIGTTTAKVGDQVLVQGTAWPARTLVHLETCGNLAIDGSADCALAASFDAGVGQDGTFSMLLTIGRPPSPCPCAVWVTDASTVSEARVPLTIVGVPVANVQSRVALPDISKQVRVTGVKLLGHGSWTSWFGTGSTRTLGVSVKNIGTYAIHDPQLSLTFGKGQDPTGFVLAPTLGTLQPGTTQSYRTPVEVGAFSVGHYTLKGAISAFGTPIVFRTGIDVRPWGLLVIALVLVQLFLLIVRNRLRHRLQHQREEDVMSDGPMDTPLASPEPDEPATEAAEPVIDLVTEPAPPVVVTAPSEVAPSAITAPGVDALALASQATRLAAEASQLAAAATAAAEAARRAAQTATEAALRAAHTNAGSPRNGSEWTRAGMTTSYGDVESPRPPDSQ